jgi:hypothetical protein
LAARWIAEGPSTQFFDTVQVGEYVTFQVAVFAARGNATNVQAAVSDLVGPAGAPVVPSSAATVFNMGGISDEGLPFTQAVNVPQGMVQPLWIGLQLPADSRAAGAYTGRVSITTDQGTASVQVTLLVQLPASGQPVPDNGFDDIYNMSRLAWLNSAFGLDDNVTAPFTPVTVNASSGPLAIGLVNKVVEINSDGMLAQGTVTAEKMRRGVRASQSSTVLSAPLEFTAYDAAGAPIAMTTVSETTVTYHAQSSVAWTATATGGGLERVITGSVEFDSYLLFNITFTATGGDVALSDMQLTAQADTLSRPGPFYMSGMGSSGGFLTPQAW